MLPASTRNRIFGRPESRWWWWHAVALAMAVGLNASRLGGAVSSPDGSFYVDECDSVAAAGLRDSVTNLVVDDSDAIEPSTDASRFKRAMDADGSVTYVTSMGFTSAEVTGWVLDPLASQDWEVELRAGRDMHAGPASMIVLNSQNLDTHSTNSSGEKARKGGGRKGLSPRWVEFEVVLTNLSDACPTMIEIVLKGRASADAASGYGLQIGAVRLGETPAPECGSAPKCMPRPEYINDSCDEIAESQALKTSTDDALVLFGKAHSASNNIVVDRSNASVFFNGDDGRFKRADSRPGMITYHVPEGITAASIAVFSCGDVADLRVLPYTDPQCMPMEIRPLFADEGYRSGCWRLKYSNLDFEDLSDCPPTYLSILIQGGEGWELQVARVQVLGYGLTTTASGSDGQMLLGGDVGGGEDGDDGGDNKLKRYLPWVVLVGLLGLIIGAIVFLRALRGVCGYCAPRPKKSGKKAQRRKGFERCRSVGGSDQVPQDPRLIISGGKPESKVGRIEGKQPNSNKINNNSSFVMKIEGGKVGDGSGREDGLNKTKSGNNNNSISFGRLSLYSSIGSANQHQPFDAREQSLNPSDESQTGSCGSGGGGFEGFKIFNAEASSGSSWNERTDRTGSINFSFEPPKPQAVSRRPKQPAKESRQQQQQQRQQQEVVKAEHHTVTSFSSWKDVIQTSEDERSPSPGDLYRSPSIRTPSPRLVIRPSEPTTPSPRGSFGAFNRLSSEQEADTLARTRSIGQGGVGSMWRSSREGAPVAIQVLVLPTTMSSEAKQQRVAVLEAAISGCISHTNIVKTITCDIREVETSHREREQQQQQEEKQQHLHGEVKDLDVHTEPSSVLSRSAKEWMTWETFTASGRSQVFIRHSKPTHRLEVRMVMEYCDAGTLRMALKDGRFRDPRSPKGVVLENVLLTALDIARGMLCLHRANIIHGDLQPHNVLLKLANTDRRGFVAKVVDFGLSVQMDSKRSNVSGVNQGTGGYMSPEVVSHRKMSPASDVYSYGIMLWELYTSTLIRDVIKEAHMRRKLTTGAWRPKFPEDCPQPFVKLASSCWNQCPDWRPSFDQIIPHLTGMLNGFA